MTTAFFQPPALWPFEPDTAVYVCHYDKASEPQLFIPAIVLWVRGTSASVQREDKTRITSMRLRNLALRGYCPACPAPAIVGAAGQLVCSECQQPAIDAPPPDDLVLRWYPLDEYHGGLLMRRAFEHPRWSHRAASHAAIETIRRASDTMLEQLGLSRLYAGEAGREGCQLGKLLDLYAALGEADAFRATYEDLCQLLAHTAAARRFDRLPLMVDSEDTYLLAQMERIREETHTPLVRPTDDSEPDGNTGTALDRWLDAQFRKAA